MGTPLPNTGSASQPTPSAPRGASPSPPTIPDPDIESNDERPACVSEKVELPWEVDMPEGAVQDKDECQPTPDARTPEPSSPTPPPEQRPTSCALDRELKRIGDFNCQEKKLPPPSKTRSGKRFES